MKLSEQQSPYPISLEQIIFKSDTCLAGQLVAFCHIIASILLRSDVSLLQLEDN
jgi:hypothetical protein